MEHDAVESLRRTSAAWRLLRADTAPLVLSFLGTVFVEENIRAIAESELVARLDDHLYFVDHDVPGLPTERGAAPVESGGRYPRTPQAYIDHWAHPDTGWLRAWYPPGADEPHYDALPAVEQAVKWVAGLRSRSFVGTESRLAIVFDLLRQLDVGTRTDPQERIRDLEGRRAQIDAEINQIKAGRLDVLDAAAQRDRYQQLTHTAADLLSDFRQVEANFRALDRRMRQRITGWDGAKGELLDEAVVARNAIADSDQGRSFHAFYDFLLDRRRQEEFAELVDRVQALDAIATQTVRGKTTAPAEVEPADDDAAPHSSPADGEYLTDAVAPDRLRRIHYDWLDAGERTQTTVRTLSEQLRRFLDDRVWMENRRVIEILRGVEVKGLAASGKRQPPGMGLDALSPDVVLPLERPLFTPRAPSRVDSEIVAGDEDFDAPALFDQVHVDPERLAAIIHEALARRGQVGLAELVADHPLEHGLAELMTYLALTDPRFVTVHDEDATDEIAWMPEAIAGDDGMEEKMNDVDDDATAEARERRAAHLDRVTYSRRGSTAARPGTSAKETAT